LEIGLGLSEVKCYPTVGITVSFIVKVTVTVQVSDNDRIWGRVWWCSMKDFHTTLNHTSLLPNFHWKLVTVQTTSATPDLLLIQQNSFCWICIRSRVAELVCTVTESWL